MNKQILPVLLGSDINVYGMARSFHEEYGIKSVAIGKGILPVCKNSNIVSVEVVEPNLEDDKIFVSTLLKFKENYPNENLLLVPCGDNYIKMLVRNQNSLKEKYLFRCIDEDLLMQLSNKESFYKVCEKNGFSFPKTIICTNSNYKSIKLPFEFPIIIKPSNSVMYWNCKFTHKKKVFIANNKQEFSDILIAIYNSSYTDNLILQEYIPGDDSAMRVINCYCGQDKKVKLLALGDVILEEHTPEGIGSYAAIINGYNSDLNNMIIKFLENIGYIGFVNFDIKYDYRDNTYKLFEMNLRQGRSSFFVTAAGYNLAKWLVDDVVYNKKLELTIAKNKVLYTIIPKQIIFKYCNNAKIKNKAKKLIKEGKVCNSYYYKKDKNIKRKIAFLKNQIHYFSKYRRYFGNKSLRN